MVSINNDSESKGDRMKITSGGNYLKADLVKKGDIIKILDEGTIETSTKFTYDDGTPKKEFVFTVEHKGIKTKMRMNKASRVALVTAFGDETKGWIGREASCYVMPTPSGDKKMIILEPIFTEADSWDK